MLTITRRQARRLRSVLRRHTLGIGHRGLVPPLVIGPNPIAGITVRHRQAALAVQCVLPGAHFDDRPVAVPLDALADLEGPDDTPIELEAAAPGRTVARWSDRGIPQVREYAVPEVAGLPPFPGLPEGMEACPGDLLAALAEAAATTEAGSARYALECIQLRGDSGEVVATDGRQILVQGGFRLPWAGDLLAVAAPLFACRELPRDRPAEVGRSEAHVVIRAGAWSVWLALRPDARFPRVDQLIPAADAPCTRLRLAAADAEFLAQALDRLPGGDGPCGPVTLDLNGKVAVRARAAAGGPPTELVLARSAYVGPPTMLSTDRAYLGRAARLGFAELLLAGAGDPVACRDGRRSYLWQPLSRESAIGPADDATRIDSTLPAAVPPPRVGGGELATVGRGPTGGRAAGSCPKPSGTVALAGADRVQASGTGMVALIQEVVDLHQAMADAKARARRLIVSLRRERKRSRLVQSTLATLRQLRLQGAVE